MPTDGQLRDELVLVLFVIFTLILCPIAIMTFFVVVRGFAKKLKFFLITTTIALASVVSTIGIIRFALLPVRMEIVNGNKVLLWDKFPSTFCSATEIVTNDTGLLVWGVRNLPTAQPTSMELRSQQNLPPTAFIVWPLHVLAGTYISVANVGRQAHKVKVVVFEGKKGLDEWRQASITDRLPVEECCAYKADTGLSFSFTTRQDDVYYTIIQSPQRTDTDDALPFDLRLNITGMTYTRGDCDPVYCKTYKKSCLIEPPTEPRIVLENIVLANRHPKVRSVKVEVSCKVRRWAFGLLFGFLPLILVAMVLACMLFTKICDSFSSAHVSAYDIDLE